MPRRRWTRRLAVIGIAAGALVGACSGDDDPSAAVADERAAQIRAAGEAAGLEEEVIGVLELAARGASATFRITFRGEGGSTIVVAQAPPDRRVDIVVGTEIVESRILRNGVGYACTIPEGEEALACERRAGTVRTEGVFTSEALEAFTANLAASQDDVELTVEERTIAGVEATCLISAPRPGTPLTGVEPGAETICLSAEGAQLLVDAAGQKVTATEYGTDVPAGTFDVTVSDGPSPDQ